MYISDVVAHFQAQKWADPKISFEGKERGSGLDRTAPKLRFVERPTTIPFPMVRHANGYASASGAIVSPCSSPGVHSFNAGGVHPLAAETETPPVRIHRLILNEPEGVEQLDDPLSVSLAWERGHSLLAECHGPLSGRKRGCGNLAGWTES